MSSDFSFSLPRGPYRTDCINSLSAYFMALKINSSSPFPLDKLGERENLVNAAMRNCREFDETYFTQEPTATAFYVDKRSLSLPKESASMEELTRRIEALDLELPFLNFRPEDPEDDYINEMRCDQMLYDKVKAPKNALEAKALGIRVSKFAEKFLGCLRTHSLAYRGLKQFTQNLDLPKGFELHLPTQAPFFNEKILRGDENFTIQGPLGRGVTGAVSKIQVGGAVFALKEFAKDDQFLQEVGASLVLPPCEEIANIAGVIPSGLILEFADKQTLAELLDSERLLSAKTIKTILLTLASALEIIHSRGFVHTDVKPNNVLCFEGDKIKLGDLGFLKKRNSNEVWRSSRYSIPPEKFIETLIEPSGDIWALGALVFSLLTKKRSPFIEHGEISIDAYKSILLEKNYNQAVSPQMLKALLSEQQLLNLSTQDPDESILSLAAECMSGHIENRPTAKELKERLLKEIEP
jgi:hypothetical protein